jgi:hypothetical protein
MYSLLYFAAYNVYERKSLRKKAKCCVDHIVQLNVSNAKIIRTLLLVDCVKREDRERNYNERYGGVMRGACRIITIDMAQRWKFLLATNLFSYCGRRSSGLTHGVVG